MADDVPTDKPGKADGLWNWSAAARVTPAQIRRAVAVVLGTPVREIGESGAGQAVLCDVWQVGGDFPTLIDCYLVPGDTDEAAAATAVAAQLGAAVLLPDDSLNPTRYVLAAPDGTRRTVHVDETETEDGPERRHARPCTGTDPACAAAPERRDAA